MTPDFYSQSLASLPAITDRLKLKWDAFTKAKQYANARKQGQLAIAFKDLLEWNNPPFTDPFPDYPNQDAKIKAFTSQIQAKKWPADYDGTICLGDSIAAFSASHLTSVFPDLNFAEPGSADLNFLTVAQAVAPVCSSVGLKINFSVEGTYWGNAMLGHQDIDACIRDTATAFKGIRAIPQFAQTKRIIYSAPLIYDVYATLNRVELEALMMKLIIEDGNAMYVSLTAGMAGWLGLFPKGAMTAEGIHLSDAAYPIFDRRIIAAKTAKPGSIITV